MRRRSKCSFAFEEFWRSLRKDGALVPSLSDFIPAGAVRFLHNIILLEAPGERRKGLKMRAVAQPYQSALQYSVSGRDHLDNLPPKYHAGALAAVRLMVSQPCGLWQVMPVHIQGHSRLVELTAFPLGPGDDGTPLILAYLFVLEDFASRSPRPEAEVSVGAALEFVFIAVLWRKRHRNIPGGVCAIIPGFCERTHCGGS